MAYQAAAQRRTRLALTNLATGAGSLFRDRKWALSNRTPQHQIHVRGLILKKTTLSAGNVKRSGARPASTRYVSPSPCMRRVHRLQRSSEIASTRSSQILALDSEKTVAKPSACTAGHHHVSSTYNGFFAAQIEIFKIPDQPAVITLIGAFRNIKREWGKRPQTTSSSEEPVLKEIAELCGCNLGPPGDFDLAIFELELGEVESSVREYFGSQIPSVSIRSKLFSAADIYRLIGRDELVEHNRQCVPSCDILAAGFVTIATDISGDAVAIDVTDGQVYLVEHETNWEEELDGDPMGRRQKVIDQSYREATTIDEFVSVWRDRLREVTAKESKRKTIAAKQQLTFSSGETYRFSRMSSIESVPVPDGHGTSNSDDTLWINKEGDRSSVVIYCIASDGPRVATAFNPQGLHADLVTETGTWRFKRGELGQTLRRY